MIHKALKLIRHELDVYLDNASATDQVVLRNISQWDPASTETGIAEMKNKVVMTLVNISEEIALKNQPRYQSSQQGTSIIQTVPLNLFILFVANRDTAQYSEALNQVGKIIRFFRGKSVFTDQNTTPPPNTIDPGDVFKMIFELAPMDFENQNHLWGMLGGKQLPCVMYRVRLVEVKAGQIPQATPISQINISQNQQ